MNSRRLFLGLPLLVPVAMAETPNGVTKPLPATFPTQEPDLVREIVGASHANLPRVKELVTARPSLAKAAWDLGFGDWETALGAASHVGNREIAQFLLENGAHPTIFSAAMLGHLDTVKAFVAASPGIQKTKGPHSINLMNHAKAGGKQAAEVVAYLETLGGADEKQQKAPISEEEMTALAGLYSFGTGATDQFEVKVTRGLLTLTRVKGSARNLFHLGSNAFYPGGAEAVRIRFVLADGKAKALTLHDPDLILTATKI